jgi:hypothetical protein
MDTEHFVPLARLTAALHDARPGSGFRHVNAALRTEAPRQLHLQQREWAGTLTIHSPGTLCLVVPAARAGFSDGLDVLRQAGEDVPWWFDQGGSLTWTREAAKRYGARAAGCPVGRYHPGACGV